MKYSLNYIISSRKEVKINESNFHICKIGIILIRIIEKSSTEAIFEISIVRILSYW